MSAKKDPRFCYYIPALQTPRAAGFRVAVVFEDEGGFRWTGGNGKEPYYWGPTLEEAEQACAEQNERLGLSAKDVADIIAQSKARGLRKR
jgi:hypothetical protein